MPKGYPNQIKEFTEASAVGARAVDERNHEASVHQTREQDERSTSDVHDFYDEPWVRPATLPHIPARSGMVQRWIRVGMHGGADPTNNWTRKQREGWFARSLESIPKNIPVPAIEKGQFMGCIGVEGMILCEMPASRNAQRVKFFRNKSRLQDQSADEMVANVNSASGHGFGKIVQSNKTEVGRLVKVAGNEA